jgi:hypothetical protein
MKKVVCIAYRAKYLSHPCATNLDVKMKTHVRLYNQTGEITCLLHYPTGTKMSIHEVITWQWTFCHGSSLLFCCCNTGKKWLALQLLSNHIWTNPIRIRKTIYHNLCGLELKWVSERTRLDSYEWKTSNLNYGVALMYPFLNFIGAYVTDHSTATYGCRMHQPHWELSVIPHLG